MTNEKRYKSKIEPSITILVSLLYHLLRMELNKTFKFAKFQGCAGDPFNFSRILAFLK